MVNPFESPQTDDSPSLDQDQGRPLWQAIASGIAADLGGSILLGIVASVGYVAWMTSEGYTLPEIEAELSNPSGVFRIAVSTLGLAISVFGGWVCGWMAPGRETKACLISATILAVLGTPVGLLSDPVWVVALLTPVGFGATMLGGWLIARSRTTSDFEPA